MVSWSLSLWVEGPKSLEGRLVGDLVSVSVSVGWLLEGRLVGGLVT